MNNDLFQRLSDFYQLYAAAIDEENWQSWVDMFTDDCIYKIQSRENHDLGLPLATLALTSKGMLQDRIYGITETIYHDPYHQCHVVSAPRIKQASDELIEAEARYAVFRTKNTGIAEVYNVGRYIDRIIPFEHGFRFQSRLCIFDNDMILNSLIYPI